MPFDSANADLQVIPVQTPDELKRFIALPARLNARDPNWITPLFMERTEALTPKTNPFFAHAEVQLFLATRGGRDVGRISAQIDQLTPQPTPGRLDGHFGMIAAEDDGAIFQVLFRAAEDWLRARGRTHVVGPFNLSINEEVGLLVEGFDTPPMILMGHDPAYTGKRVEEQGYAKAKDVFAYRAGEDGDIPEVARRRVKRGLPEGVVLRQLDMKRYDEEVRTLTDILNDAWKENWGFTATTEAETAQLGKALKQVIDKRLIWFAEIDGEAAGVVVFLPNVNEAIADLKGKLLPFGWAKLLWRLKVKGVKSARIPLMGVKKKFANTQRGRMLPFWMMKASRDMAMSLGYNRYEISWVLEDNKAMCHIAENVGGTHYKTYRIYEKAL
ncbi:ceramide synthase [Caulobacter sp.]|uniref:ceramide synthase n=1 Tax=Caulobacter sp. TaxID=78 RepID=UPI001B0FC7F4|nr:ceramide synthase [Caulobacter sp.]MBO9544789.1 dATP pyrophosphohydrolase [Caulobacter sp.]